MEHCKTAVSQPSPFTLNKLQHTLQKSWMPKIVAIQESYIFALRKPYAHISTGPLPFIMISKDKFESPVFSYKTINYCTSFVC